MKDNGQVMAFGAHPDDVEFTCAGTLARLQRKGYRIAICVVCNGDCGSAELGPKKIARIRHGEAKRAAKVIGAEYVNLGVRDVELCFDVKTRRKVIGVLRQFDPFLVFAPPPMDYMFDHIITSQLVMDATFSAAIPNATSKPDDIKRTSGVPYLYYCTPMEDKDIFGQPWPLSFYVDIAETLDVKRQMLVCHDSQRSWLMAQHGMDHYIEFMKEWAHRRGQKAGVEYAEGFRQHLGHPYPQDNILDQILGVIPAKSHA